MSLLLLFLPAAEEAEDITVAVMFTPPAENRIYAWLPQQRTHKPADESLLYLWPQEVRSYKPPPESRIYEGTP